MTGRITLFVATGLLAVAFMVWSVHGARGHDDMHLSDWIGNTQQRNPITGAYCCGKDDCFPLPPGSVSFDGARNGWVIEPTKEFVPDKEALPSRDNHFWRCHRHDGTRQCFFKPRGGV